ncbi:GcrA family cell cycle regulator [Acetobacter estunensis]|uniref:GcrA family cell cycle regulator n=1 Tax=Acetobacter estunensis TaxID=104097 RepID=UPI001C2CCF6F|nr:GcrA family cell cycle regulator [Acetobacter estunensis]MBV1838851.1 GcrA family cell cycle regulator [Acetobacter estunensis]
MEWTDETIGRLKALWQEGLSTAEIGRQLGITKNAVVGKAHRLGLPPRPSPIRRQDAKTAKSGEKKVSSRRATKTETPADGESVVSVASAPEEKAAAPAEAVTKAPVVSPPAVEVAQTVVAPIAPSPVAEKKAAVPVVAEDVALEEKPASDAPKKKAAPRPAFRPASTTSGVEPRRRGASCCWPIGDPGTPEFHFCGATPLPGKPYCAEHAALAYVKLRDRRDS